MQFDHEKLDVYKLLLKLIRWVSVLMREVEGDKKHRVRHIFDHLDRASLSGLLNTAEGNGKRQGRLRAKFFDDARGSSTECAACLDALVAKEACTTERTGEGKDMLIRIVSMLTKLVKLNDDRLA